MTDSPTGFLRALSAKELTNAQRWLGLVWWYTSHDRSEECTVGQIGRDMAEAGYGKQKTTRIADSLKKDRRLTRGRTSDRFVVKITAKAELDDLYTQYIVTVRKNPDERDGNEDTPPSRGTGSSPTAADGRRTERVHAEKLNIRWLSPGESDRSRIMGAWPLRRLAGITQVVTTSPSQSFHNRLTHVIAVAQVGRSLANRLVSEEPDVAVALGGIDPDVVESACLAHDLGHPPFGHIAEEELDRLLIQSGFIDGFEGNAQTFRVVTKLASRAEYPGLNLTRATLNALLKYPWLRATMGPQRNKWGAYHTEKTEFDFARALTTGTAKSVEAEIMDWADDIAYSIHDMADFYEAGKIPLDRLAHDEEEQASLVEGICRRKGESDPGKYLATCRELFYIFPFKRPFRGVKADRQALSSLTRFLTDRYTKDVFLAVPNTPASRSVLIDPAHRVEVEILKQLTWQYVIEDPALVGHQDGLRKIIRGLFEVFHDAVTKKRWTTFPPRVQEQLAELHREGLKEEQTRVAADLIAGMTEHEAVATYRRLTGQSVDHPLAATMS